MPLALNNSFNTERQLQFLGDFGQWLADGQAPDKALLGMELIAKERKDSQEIRIIRKLRNSLAQGKPIAVGMKGHFKKELQQLVDAGQKAGCLPELIDSYNVFRERRYALLKRLGRGLVYPFVLLISALIAIAFIGNFILPKFQSLDNGQKMPWFTNLLQALGKYIWEFGPILILSITCVISCLYLLFSRIKHQELNFINRLTPFAVFRAYNAIYLLQGLSLFLSCGLSLDGALRTLESRSSNYLNHHIKVMRKALAQGETRLLKVFTTGLFGPVTLYRIDIGVSTNQSKGKLFAELANRTMRDVEWLLIKRQRVLAYFCFALAIALILLIILGFGQLFTDLAKQWS